MIFIYFYIGMWLSLVECLVRDEEAAGSNPVIPTRGNRMLCGLRFFVSSFVSKNQERN